MAAKRLRFKPTLRDQQQMSLNASRFYASMSPPEKAESAAQFLAESAAKIKPVRERAAPRQLEAPVVAAISELLAVHPHVLIAVRQNSGMASYEAKSGQYAPVFFYKLLGPNAKHTTITDFWGLLRDGRPFAVEAKAPGFKQPRTDREFKQANFLALVRNCGGIGLFATSAEDVASALR